VQDFDLLIDAYLHESVRFTHARDIVPSLPLPLFGYHHFAREIWQLPDNVTSAASAKQMRFRICDGSGEDPTCHNSACWLGLCRSLDDHIHYLGKHMYHRVGEC
jgi:hypothetical protein